MATKAELKARLVTGHVITEQDMKDLIDVAGKQGPQGPPGTDGADGFPTEQQWNDLVARVDALENPEA